MIPQRNGDIAISFDDGAHGVWGYVEYNKPLTKKQISDYELTDKATETKQVNVAPDIDVDTKTESEVEQPTEEPVTEETEDTYKY